MKKNSKTVNIAFRLLKDKNILNISDNLLKNFTNLINFELFLAENDIIFGLEILCNNALIRMSKLQRLAIDLKFNNISS